MLEDDFYCTIKFKGGDEIFAKVAAEVEEDRTMLLVSNPIVVEEVKLRGTVVGHKFEPWLKSTTEDMFLVNMEYSNIEDMRRKKDKILNQVVISEINNKLMEITDKFEKNLHIGEDKC